MDDYIKQMPKIELHAHLNGSLSTEVLLELGALKYGNASDDFKTLCKSFKIVEPSLSECFAKFKVAHDVTATKEALQLAVLRVVRDFAKDNVIYLELRSTPKTTASISKLEYLTACIEGIRSAQEKYPEILVKFIPSIDRSKGTEDAEETLTFLLQLLEDHGDIIKGIDLSGNPRCGAFKDFIPALNKARANNLKLTLHSGEVENDEEISEMLEFGMDRLGHGTFIREQNWEKLLKKKIPVECCLSSNVKTGTVTSFDDHHFMTLWEHNNPVVLATDDFGVFDTTLSNEFIIAANTFKLEKKDLYRICKCSVESSFANENEKECLMQSINLYFKNLE